MPVIETLLYKTFALTWSLFLGHEPRGKRRRLEEPEGGAAADGDV